MHSRLILDGSNDVFFPITQCAFEEYDLVIFNRWGQLIYKSTNQNEKWDGKHNGVDCEIEVYSYLLTYKIESQIKKQKKGVSDTYKVTKTKIVLPIGLQQYSRVRIFNHKVRNIIKALSIIHLQPLLQTPLFI
jgi:gliding motility-associated-like protein